MTPKIDFLYCDSLLSSRELDDSQPTFLKSNSPPIPPRIHVPETYLCDILLDNHSSLEEFSERVIANYRDSNFDSFTCAVIRIQFPENMSTSTKPEAKEKKKDTTFLEQRLNTLIIPGEGIWQWLTDATLIIALSGELDTTEQILHSILDSTDSLSGFPSHTGAATFPYHGANKGNGQNAENIKPSETGVNEENEANGLNATNENFNLPNWYSSPEQTLHNAVKALDHAVFLGPGSVVFFDDVTQNIFGDRLYQLGQNEAAAAEYRKGLEINPDNINLLNSLGVCYSIMNQLASALEQFERALAIENSEFMLLYNAGLTCNLLDDLDKGIEYLKTATLLNNSVYDAELTAAILLLKADKTDEALPHINNAVRLNPGSAIAHRILGELFLQMNEPKEASREYSSAIKLNPWDASAISGLARAYEIQNKNLDIALDLASHSIMIAPENPYFRIRRAKIYLKMGLFDFADSDFSKAEAHINKQDSGEECIEKKDFVPKQHTGDSTAASQQPNRTTSSDSLPLLPPCESKESTSAAKKSA